jgi:thiamine-monophosphate kinase
MDEFALIRQHFAGLTPPTPDVVLGIGDDAALIVPPPGFELAITTDTLVAGRHFPETTTAYDIGWKSLAVNLSDLAAMGAQPRWFQLSLTMPDENPVWLKGFAAGLGELARASGITLTGGDTTRGPLSVSITAIGIVAASKAIRRIGAQPGDLVCVTGTLGDAALALRFLTDQSWKAYDDAIEPLEHPIKPNINAEGAVVAGILPPLPRLAVSATDRVARPNSGSPDFDFLYGRLDRPQPRVVAGLALRDHAHAAIDLSDGLAGDLQHVLDASGVGAAIELDHLPMSPAFAGLSRRGERLRLQAAGGDDYELCVCIPPECFDAADAALGDLPLTPIGRIVHTPGLRWLDADGKTVEGPAHGYRHF